MSLQEFTWQQFLIAAVVLSALWALGVWLIYWRPLSGRRGKSRFGGEDALPHSWQDEVDDLEGAGQGLMGKPALEHGVSVLEADEFSFAPLGERGEREEHDEGGERGERWAPNLPRDLEEAQFQIQNICRRMEREDGTKEDFFALFTSVRDSYPRLAGSELMGELNDFIREQVPFFISDQELESLWV